MNLKNIAVVEDDNIPDEAKLGHLVGVVHTSISVPVEEMNKLFEENNYPERLWPKVPRELFAFQAAVRKLTEKKIEEFVDPGSGITVQFEVEYFVDVLPNDVRQLSRKIQYKSSISANDIPDDIKKQLEIYVERTQKEPEKMALFEFNNGEIIKTDLFEKNDLSIREQTQEKHEQLTRIYNQIKGCYTERYIKDSWYRLLHEVGAIPYMLSNGSVWFVPKKGTELLGKFAKIYTSVHNGSGIFRTIPVIDTEQQRKYLKSDVQKHVENQYKSFLENVAKRVEGIKSEADMQKLKENLGEKKSDFEREMRDTLIKQYSELLDMSISAKITDQVPKSDRMRIAQKFLANL